MAPSTSADVSPTTALFHSLWLVEPNRRRQRNAAADGFIEVRLDQPRRRGIAKSWSITAECGCGEGYQDHDDKDCEEVYNMLYLPPKLPYSPPPPTQPKSEMDVMLKPGLHRVDPCNLLSWKQWRRAGRLPFFPFSLSWFCYLPSNMIQVLKGIFYFLVPTAWFYAQWIRFNSPIGTPWPGERGTIYVALPEPGRKDETEYRIPFISERIFEAMAEQAASHLTDKLYVYNVPRGYKDEVTEACKRFGLTTASVRPPAGVYDCIWAVRDGKVVWDLRAKSENLIVVGKNSKLVDLIAAQAKRRSAALIRHYDYLRSRRARLMKKSRQILDFFMPANPKNGRPRELSREELLGDESVLRVLGLPTSQPSPLPPNCRKEDERLSTQEVYEVCQEEYLVDHRLDMGIEHDEDIPYIKLY